MPPPKVLLLPPDFPPAPGGIQVVAHRLAEHTSRIEVGVVTLGEPGDRDFDRLQGFPVKRVGARRGPHRARVGLLNVMGAAEGLRRRPDVILSLHVVTGPAAALTGRVLGVPVAQYRHADEMRARSSLTRRAIAASRGVIAVSSHTADMARRLGATP